jgi:hypothetical protein
MGCLLKWYTIKREIFLRNPAFKYVQSGNTIFKIENDNQNQGKSQFDLFVQRY